MPGEDAPISPPIDRPASRTSGESDPNPPQGGADPPPSSNLLARGMVQALASLPFLLFILAWFFDVGLSTWHRVLVFDDMAFNGPFQLWNPLRRIAAGQRGGLDFQFFHGLGIPYLHFPVYHLLGQTLQASELSRYGLSLSLFLLTLLSVLHAAGARGQILLISLSSLLLICGLMGLNGLYLPGHSLMAVRIALPALAFALLLGKPPSIARSLLLGLILGLGVLLGTEQGLAALAGFALASIPLCFVKRFPTQTLLQGLLATLGAVLAIALPLLWLGGPTGASRAIRYAFIEVPADQFWYFGGPPNGYVESWPDLLRRSEFMAPVLLGLALSMGCLALMRRGEERFGFAALMFLLYGLFSSASYLGTASPAYLVPLKRSILLSLAAGALLFGPRIQLESATANRLFRALRPTLWLAMLVPLLWGYPGKPLFPAGLSQPTAMRDVFQALWSMTRDPATPPLAARWQTYLHGSIAAIDADREIEGPGPFTLWSTYAGLLEAHYRLFNPSHDYIIHALGPGRRAAYLSTFRDTQPDYVQTLRRSYIFFDDLKFAGYEEFLQNVTWDFYADILRNYEVLHRSPVSILWKRRKGPWIDAPPFQTEWTPHRGQAVAFGSASSRFPIPIDVSSLADGSVLVLRLDYQIGRSDRPAKRFSRLARFIVRPLDSYNTNPISLPPYRRSITFPILIRAGQTPALQLETVFGGPGFRVSKLSWYIVPPDDTNRLLLRDDLP